MIKLLSNVTFSLIFLLGFSSAAFATQADLDAELEGYIALFKGNNYQEQRRSMDSLQWSGISDPALYDIIADQLVSMKGSKDKADLDKGAWFAKALAYSGQEQYRSTLQDVAENAKKKKLRKYAEQSILSLDNHKAWNPVIAKGLASAPRGALAEVRVSNMLASSRLDLLRIGAKRVYYAHKNDEQLLEQAAQRLDSEFSKVDKGNKTHVDAVNWLIKAMAESGQVKYKPLLEKVAREAQVKKVQKYAEKYAEYFD